MSKRYLIIGCLLCVGIAAFAIKPKPLVYNGDTLPQSDIFRRSKCGVVSEAISIPEVSGIACSRVTPGYIWMESDDHESYIIATDAKGEKRACTLKMSKSIGWDWEDMSGGVYEGKNYLFIGSFGDNEEKRTDYRIIWFEEPAIDSVDKPEQVVTPNYIKYVYPDGKSHNNEALMYDNVEQMIYIITKVYYNVCQVFSLPFRLDYGSETQTLTYVCDLGVKSDLGDGTNPYKGFHLVTAADISPDGKYVLIKNHNNIQAIYSWVLYWEREGNESIAETVKRQPVVLDCYQYEWQGEAICWLDDDTFYTTSDSDGEPPIYKYTRRGAEGIDQTRKDHSQCAKYIMNGQLYIRRGDQIYTIAGQPVKQ